MNENQLFIQDRAFGLAPRPTSSRLYDRLKAGGALLAIASQFLPRTPDVWGGGRLLAAAAVAWLLFDPIRGWVWDIRVARRRRSAERLEAAERLRAIECVRRAVVLVKAHADPSSSGSGFAQEVNHLPNGAPPDRIQVACLRRDLVLEACAFERHLPEVNSENLNTVSGMVADIALRSLRKLNCLFDDAVADDRSLEAAERIREQARVFVSNYSAIADELSRTAPRFSGLLSPIPVRELPRAPKILPTKAKADRL